LQYSEKNHPIWKTLNQQLAISWEKPPNAKKHSINSLQYPENNHRIRWNTKFVSVDWVFFRIGWFFAGYFKLLIECFTVLVVFSGHFRCWSSVFSYWVVTLYEKTLDQQLAISWGKPPNTVKHSINSLQYPEKKHVVFLGYCKLLVKCFFFPLIEPLSIVQKFVFM
jgi:hypothetical protein